MAETLGELIVRLGLDANTFQAGLTNISRQMKLSNAEFQAFGKAALASGDNLEVLRVKSNSLNTNMELQRQRIEDLAQSSDKYAARIEELKNKQDDLRVKVDAAKKAYDESANSKGKDSEETQALKEEYEKLEGSLSKNEEMLKKAGVRLDETTIKTKQAEGNLADMGVELESVNKKISQLESNLYQSGVEMKKLGDSVQKSGKELKEAGKVMEDAGKTLSVAVTAPIVAFGAGAIKAAIDFESAFTGVTKTIDMTAQETEAMRQAIIKTSEKLPHSKEAISEVAQAAGQLGIEKENILEFTKVMLNMGVATDMTSTAAATAMARFANITQMPQENFEKLGSTIVELGNNFATTEEEITEMALRLAGAGDQIGLTEAEILGFSTALSSVGIQAEAGGSAFSKAMIQMQVASEAGSIAFDQLESHANSAGLSLSDVSSAVRFGGKELKSVAGEMGLTSSELKKMYKEAEKASDKLEDFAYVAGMSADEFAIKFREDAAGAIAAFIQGLGDVEGAGQSTILMLEDMGLTEVRLRDSLTRLAGNSELVGDAVNTASKAWEENIALTKEAEKFNATTANQIEVLKNRVNSIATEIGDDLTPKLLELGNKAVDTVTKKWSGMTKEQKEGTIHMAAAAAATGPVILGLGKLTSGIGSTFTNTGKFISYLGDTKKALSGVGDTTTVLAKVLPALTSPAGIAVLAISGITVAAKLLYDHFSQLSDIEQAWVDQQDRAAAALESAGERMAAENKVIIDSFNSTSDEVLGSLQKISDESSTITEEIATSLIGGFESMGNQLRSTIESKNAELVSTMQETYLLDGVISEEEQAMLTSITEGGKLREEKVYEIQNAITQIVQSASNDRRALTAQEEADILAHYQELYQLMSIEVSDGETKLLILQDDIRRGRVDLNKETIGEIKAVVDEGYQGQLDSAANFRANAIQQLEEEKRVRLYYAQGDEERALINEKFDMMRDDVDSYYSELLQKASQNAADTYATIQEQYENERALVERHLSEMNAEIEKARAQEGVGLDAKGREIAGIRQKYNAEELEDQMRHFDELGKLTQKMLDEKMMWAEKMGEEGLKTGESWGDGIVKGVDGSATKVQQASEDLMQKHLIDASRNAIRSHSPSKESEEIGTDWGEGLVIGIKNKQSDIETTAAETARLALERIEQATQPFYQAGYNLGAGASDGLRDAGQYLIAEARSMAAAAVQAMRDELDIHSPSRVARNIFQQVGEGAVLGLRDEQQLLANAARQLASLTEESITPKIRISSQAGHSTATTQQQPVAQPRSGGDIKIEIKEIKIVSDNVKSPYEAERIGRNTADSIARNLRLKGVFMPR